MTRAEEFADMAALSLGEYDADERLIDHGGRPAGLPDDGVAF